MKLRLIILLHLQLEQQKYNSLLRQKIPAFQIKLCSWDLKQTSLVVSKKVLLPPLYIKVGLMKQFVKSLNPEGDAFKRI